MDKIIKTKRKALNGKYYDYLFQVTKYLQSENLTKYAFYKLRDQAIEDIYKAQEEGIPLEKIYKRGIDIHFQKKAEKLPKMGVIEQISNILMIVFALFSILGLFVYVYHFIEKVDSYYSEGMYLFISIDNLRNMIIYGFLGILVSTFLQKIDKRRKYIQAGIVGTIGVVIIIILTGLSSIITNNIKINIIIFLPICLLLSVCFYFINDFISKKKFKTNTVIEN